MDIAEEAVAGVQGALLSWFDATGRRLPWRETGDGYAILVSEVMLQQTQVDRVIPVYHAFLRRVPHLREPGRRRPPPRSSGRGRAWATTGGR